MDPIAPIEPDDPVTIDSFEAMIAAMDEMVARAEPLEEAFNPNQARFPKGHARAGQWRPKLVTGAGRVAPGHLERDLAGLKETLKSLDTTYSISSATPPQRHLNEVGDQIEKIALRYSARKTYEKRLTDIRAERKAIQDRMWGEWEKLSPTLTPEEWAKTDVRDLLTPADSKRLSEIQDEEIRLMRNRDHADRDAMLGVLQKIRPMGGKLNQAKTPIAVDQASGIAGDYETALGPVRDRAAMKDDLDASLKQVLKVVPKAWLDDTNSKGSVSWVMSKNRAYASTSIIEPERPKDQFRDMENAVDQALKGDLPQGLVWQAASDVLNERGPRDPTPAEREARLARRDALAEKLMHQKYTWVGRAGSPQNPNYPKGLWAVVKGEDGNRYYVDWGGNLHLMRAPADTDSPVTRANLTMQVQEGRREDRRVKNLPITTKQQSAIDNALARGGAYAGMYDDRYPVVRRSGTEEGGIGPNAAIYDWVDDNGAMKNLRLDEVAPDKKFDETKWDRQAPRPPVQPSTTDTIIRVDPRNRNTVLHELSHRLEIVYGTENPVGYTPISMATHAWLAKRTGDEPVQKLADLYPGYAYEDHELTRPDKFVDGYIGKLYPGQVTEVLTMGMEMLWFPRYGTRDINDDPEMRRLILGILATV